MSIFSVFETFTRFRDFVHEERGFEHREGVIRDQRQKTNQNMYKKVKNKFHLNFALAEPYTHFSGKVFFMISFINVL